MTFLLSVDPGGSTGWALFYFDAGQRLTHIEHGTIPGGLDGFIGWWRHDPISRQLTPGQDIVVAEGFRLDGRTVSPDLTPVAILGALRVLWPNYVTQMNTQKAQAPDDLLKRADLWWPGKGHDRDAARHAIAYTRNIVHIPTLEWLHPRRKECK